MTWRASPSGRGCDGARDIAREGGDLSAILRVVNRGPLRMTSDQRSHWDNVYTTKTERDLSWFQETCEPSRTLIGLVGAGSCSSVIDVGGGASRLVDELSVAGFRDLTVLDLSAAALAVARDRLGEKGVAIDWIADDICDWKPRRSYDVWHDRAAFHFLTDEASRVAYMDRVRAVIHPGGHVILGTFAPDGPQRCSGLPVQRHDAGTIGALLGTAFELVDCRRHDHRTPTGGHQIFQFATFVRRS